MSRPETIDADEDDLAYAIGRYALGGISIGKAAELAGVDRWTMMDVLEETGIELRLGLRDEDDLKREVGRAFDRDPDDLSLPITTDDDVDGEE